MSGSFSAQAENKLLLLLFNNTNWTNVGDASGLLGSGTAGSFYIALHTADPQAGGASAQNGSEATYTGYARIAVARSSAGWTVSTNSVTNAADITFGTCTSGSSTVTHFSIGRDSGTGTGMIIMSGPISVAGGGTSLAVTAGVEPIFTAGTITATVT